jgi:hypothetical protein
VDHPPLLFFPALHLETAHSASAAAAESRTTSTHHEFLPGTKDWWNSSRMAYRKVIAQASHNRSCFKSIPYQIDNASRLNTTTCPLFFTKISAHEKLGIAVDGIDEKAKITAIITRAKVQRLKKVFISDIV